MSGDPIAHRPAAPLTALPSPRARAAAFAAICVGGLLGLLLGYAVVDAIVADASSVALVVAAVIGAVAGAGGTSVLAVIALRASPEWRKVDIDGPAPDTRLGRT